MKMLRAQNFWYAGRDWLFIDRRVRRECKGAEIIMGLRTMRNEEERICRYMNWAGERRRA